MAGQFSLGEKHSWYQVRGWLRRLSSASEDERIQDTD